MLEVISQIGIRENVCRLANTRRRLDSLLALNIKDVDEILAFLGGDGDAEELLDAPFRTYPAYRPGPTRFSDGSWPVFYSAVGWETADAEVGYHVAVAAIGTNSPLYYQRVECAVEGEGYDLRSHVGTWPFLTDPVESDAYAGCQALAREARGNDADAFVSLSARRPEGVNIPVFTREALSSPKITGAVALIFEAGKFRVESR